MPELSAIDILIFDVEELTSVLVCERPQALQLVALAPAAYEESLFDAIEGGAAAFLIRPSLTPAGLVACLDALASGSACVPPDLVASLVNSLARGGERGVAGSLATREREVLRLLAEGAETREIAEVLSYSERTVKNIVHDLLAKMNCRTRAQAVGVAMRHGVI